MPYLQDRAQRQDRKGGSRSQSAADCSCCVLGGTLQGGCATRPAAERVRDSREACCAQSVHDLHAGAGAERGLAVGGLAARQQRPRNSRPAGSLLGYRRAPGTPCRRRRCTSCPELCHTPRRWPLRQGCSRWRRHGARSEEGQQRHEMQDGCHAPTCHLQPTRQTPTARAPPAHALRLMHSLQRGAEGSQVGGSSW